MAKLWEKGYEIDERVERFMTGDDPELDLELITYDCLGSIAHAKMLATIDILKKGEAEELVRSLVHIYERAKRGEFHIAFEDEDVHTAIENALTSEHGELGKKIHTARSRNDTLFCTLANPSASLV